MSKQPLSSNLRSSQTPREVFNERATYALKDLLSGLVDVALGHRESTGEPGYRLRGEERDINSMSIVDCFGLRKQQTDRGVRCKNESAITIWCASVYRDPTGALT